MKCFLSSAKSQNTQSAKHPSHTSLRKPLPLRRSASTGRCLTKRWPVKKECLTLTAGNLPPAEARTPCEDGAPECHPALKKTRRARVFLRRLRSRSSDLSVAKPPSGGFFAPGPITRKQMKYFAFRTVFGIDDSYRYRYSSPIAATNALRRSCSVGGTASNDLPGSCSGHVWVNQCRRGLTRQSESAGAKASSALPPDGTGNANEIWRRMYDGPSGFTGSEPAAGELPRHREPAPGSKVRG